MIEGEKRCKSPSENDPPRVIVEKVYGVNHVAYERLTGKELQVEPSDGIRNELEQLPSGTLVGIEYTPELNSNINKGGLVISFSPKTLSYWKNIEKICLDANLKVVYLEDYSIQYKMAKQMAIFHKCGNLLGDIEKYSTDKDKEERIQLLKLKRYEAVTRHNYLFGVEREKAMVLKIAEQKPTVVVIGQGHADNLILNDVFELKPYGIYFKDYTNEEVLVDLIPDLTDEENEEYLYDDEFKVTDDKWIEKAFSVLFTDCPELHPYNVITQQSRIRALKAIEERKITDGNPNLMGTWDLDCWPRGLFELYIEERREDDFVGRIEDVLGTAIVNGTITKDRIKFVKVYDPNKSLKDVLRGKIYYDAVFQPIEGRYRGVWHENSPFLNSFVVESGKIKIVFPINKCK